jgi:hypothetical protein
MEQPTSYPVKAMKAINNGRGAGYGMDAALDKKRTDKYDKNAELEAITWIEAITCEKFSEQTFGDALKDGTVLCNLINKIRPRTVKKINKMKMPFMQMENIAMFLQGCRAVGVADHDCFETVDLYEQKDLGVVVSCLHALGRAVQKNVPDWDGPVLGPKEAAKNVREFTQQQLNAGKGVMSQISAGSSATMEKAEITKTGITFGADYSGSDGDNTMTLLGLGSKGIMERVPVSQPGITFGADSSGSSAYGDNNIPLLGLGSKDIMERNEVSKPGITFGADNAGGSMYTDNSIPLLGLGSKGIMERNEVSKPGITFGADAGAGGSPTTTTAAVTNDAEEGTETVSTTTTSIISEDAAVDTLVAAWSEATTVEGEGEQAGTGKLGGTGVSMGMEAPVAEAAVP